MPSACASLWIGPSLGLLERACLKSVVAQGHPLTLYCYSAPAGVPPGIELRDASTILPAERVIRHRNGSVALFSNWFRYELQRRDLGIWVDCDLYLLAPLPPADGYLFGEQAPGTINSAVLRLPPDSPMIHPLIGLFEERSVPDWLSLPARLAARWRLTRTGRAGLSKMPWGAAGPQALTAIARRFGLLDRALPSDVFYPMQWQDAGWIADPDVRIEDVITPRTVAIHLWNECIKAFKHAPPPRGSFLERLHAEGRA